MFLSYYPLSNYQKIYGNIKINLIIIFKSNLPRHGGKQIHREVPSPWLEEFSSLSYTYLQWTKSPPYSTDPKTCSKYHLLSPKEPTLQIGVRLRRGISLLLTCKTGTLCAGKWISPFFCSPLGLQNKCWSVLCGLLWLKLWFCRSEEWEPPKSPGRNLWTPFRFWSFAPKWWNVWGNEFQKGQR